MEKDENGESGQNGQGGEKKARRHVGTQARRGEGEATPDFGLRTQSS